MIEDKLSRDERIRLEAVAQVIQRAASGAMRGSIPPSLETLLTEARAVEKFILGDADALGRKS